MKYHVTPQGFHYYHLPDGLYEAQEMWRYKSPRYGKWVKIKRGQVRDGASGAWDITSLSWWVHDQLCADGKWEDLSPVTAWQCANVLRDILRSEGRLLRGYYWHWATFLFGCKRPRKNGWFTAKGK